MVEDLHQVKRQVMMTITFPGGTPRDIQDAVLNSIKLAPHELIACPSSDPAPPSKAVDEDGLAHDPRRVKASEKGLDPDALWLTIIYPRWMPKEIPPQANKKILASAENIVNEYMARRLVGSG